DAEVRPAAPSAPCSPPTAICAAKAAAITATASHWCPAAAAIAVVTGQWVTRHVRYQRAPQGGFSLTGSRRLRYGPRELRDAYTSQICVSRLVGSPRVGVAASVPYASVGPPPGVVYRSRSRRHALAEGGRHGVHPHRWRYPLADMAHRRRGPLRARDGTARTGGLRRRHPQPVRGVRSE